jgi:hypothetical protein
MISTRYNFQFVASTAGYISRVSGSDHGVKYQQFLFNAIMMALSLAWFLLKIT